MARSTNIHSVIPYRTLINSRLKQDLNSEGSTLANKQKGDARTEERMNRQTDKRTKRWEELTTTKMHIGATNQRTINN